MQRVPHRVPRFSWRWLPALLLVPVLLACSIGSETGGTTTTTTGSGTTTPTGPSCATHATTTAEAWVVGQQVVGSIGGSAAGALSHFVYPLGLPNEQDSGNLAVHPGNIAWAPDAHHLAVDIYQPIPDSTPGTYPYVVDTSTHAVTKVPLPGDATNDGLRNLTWADNQTLLILTGDTPGKVDNSAPPSTGAVYSYNIATNAVTTLPGISHVATDGVVRCSTLFYMELTGFAGLGMDSNGANEYRGSAKLHRYNLTTHTEIGSPLTFSDTFNADGSFGFYMVPGWDVSRDGTHIAYQHMAVHLSTGPNDPSTSSTFVAANPDGSSATPIFGGGNPVVTHYSTVPVSISPNGSLVAITAANPTPNIVTDSMSGGSVRYYTPDGYQQPAWLADSSGFDATAEGSSSRNIERYLLSTPLNPQGRAPGAVQVSNATDAASLP